MNVIEEEDSRMIPSGDLEDSSGQNSSNQKDLRQIFDQTEQQTSGARQRHQERNETQESINADDHDEEARGASGGLAGIFEQTAAQQQKKKRGF